MRGVAMCKRGMRLGHLPGFFGRVPYLTRGNRGGDGGGRGRGGGKGGKGRGRGECFVCGSVEHRAADCPRAFRREDGHAG